MRSRDRCIEHVPGSAVSVRGLPRATPRTQVTVAILLRLLELAAATSDQRGPSCWGCVQCGSVWSGCGRAAVGPRFGGAAGGCCRSAAWASLSLGGAGGGGVCGDGVRVRAACSALSRPTLQMGTRRHEAGCPRSELDVGTACALSRPKCRRPRKNAAHRSPGGAGGAVYRLRDQLAGETALFLCPASASTRSVQHLFFFFFSQTKSL